MVFGMGGVLGVVWGYDTADHRDNVAVGVWDDVCWIWLLKFHRKGDPVSLNIEDQETIRLADELANLTGETVTEAITVALRERLERVRHERTVEERLKALRAITQRTARMLRDGPSAVDHGDLLYDERGLPK